MNPKENPGKRNHLRHLVMIFSFFFLILCSPHVLAAFETDISGINSASVSPQIYSPEYNSDYKMPEAVLNLFHSRLVSRYEHFKPKTKLVAVYLENSEAIGLRKFFSWFRDKRSLYTNELSSHFSDADSFCTFFIAHSPSLPYILLVFEDSCSEFSLPEDFFDKHPFEFESPDIRQEEAISWFKVLANELIGEGKTLAESKILCLPSSEQPLCVADSKDCSGDTFEFDSEEQCNTYQELYLNLDSLQNEFSMTDAVSVELIDEQSNTYQIILSSELKKDLSNIESQGKIEFNFLKNVYLSSGTTGMGSSLSSSGKFNLPSAFINTDEVLVFCEGVIRLKDDSLSQLFSDDELKISIETSFNPIPKKKEDDSEESSEKTFLCKTDSDDIICTSSCDDVLFEFDSESKCDSYLSDWLFLVDLKTTLSDSFYLDSEKVDSNSYKVSLELNPELSSFLSDMREGNMLLYDLNDRVNVFRNNQLSNTLDLSPSGTFIVHGNYDYAQFSLTFIVKDEILQTLLGEESFSLVIKKQLPSFDFPSEEDTSEGKDEDSKDVFVPSTSSRKSSEDYNNKHLFLVSDEDWQSVLSLVPVTTWHSVKDSTWCHKGYNTALDVCVYPTMVFHEELTGIDADAVIDFINDYQPEEITVVYDNDYSIPGDLANLLYLEDDSHGIEVNDVEINDITPDEYIYFWGSYDTVLYCEDNYRLALFASVYASHRNIPLIIEGNSLDDWSFYSHKKVLCVGDVSFSECDIKLSLDDLYSSYCSEVDDCLKQIYVNPDDLDIFEHKSFQPSYSSGEINRLFEGNSLLAPFLAAAKEELIIPVESGDASEVDKTIENSLFKIADIPEPEYGYSSLGDPNTKGYTTFSKDFYYVRDQFQISIPEDFSEKLSSSTHADLWIGGAFLDCEIPALEVSLLAEGKEIWRETVSCTDNLTFLDIDRTSKFPNMGDWIKIRLPDKLSTKEFTLNFEGASLLFYDSDKYAERSFYYLDGITGKKPISYYCDARNKDVCLLPNIEEEKKEISTVSTSLFRIAQESNWNIDFEFGKVPAEFIIPVEEDQTLFFGIDFDGRVNLNFEFEVFVNGIKVMSAPAVSGLEKTAFRARGEDGVVNITIKGPSNLLSIYPDFLFSISVRMAKMKNDVELNPVITTFGYHEAIQERAYVATIGSPSGDSYVVNEAVDQTTYANLFSKMLIPNVPVGRIKGISTSDVSSIVYRSLLYDKLIENEGNMVLMTTADPDGLPSYIRDKKIALDFGDVLSKTDLNVNIHSEDAYTFDFDPNLWKNRQFVIYLDHGNKNWAGINSKDIPKLDSSLVSLTACSTCSTDDPESFCFNLIRKGAVGVIGATVSVAFTGQYVSLATIQDMFNEGSTLGESFRTNYAYSFYQNMFELLGDPTFKLPRKIPLDEILF